MGFFTLELFRMRKFYTLITLSIVALSTTSYAQNLQLITHDANTEANSSYLHEVKAYVQITNTGNDATYDVARLYNGSTGIADSNYFCWDLCYGVDADSSSFGGLLLENNVRNTDFYIGVHIRGNNVTEQDSLVYRFYNAADTSDYLDVTFYISVSPTVSTIETQARTVSVYPNPATDVIYVETKGLINGKIRLMNMAGQTVKTKNFSGDDRTNVDVRDLPAGVYMLQTTSSGQVKDVQRIVIAR